MWDLIGGIFLWACVFMSRIQLLIDYQTKGMFCSQDVSAACHMATPNCSHHACLSLQIVSGLVPRLRPLGFHSKYLHSHMVPCLRSNPFLQRSVGRELLRRLPVRLLGRVPKTVSAPARLMLAQTKSLGQSWLPGRLRKRWSLYLFSKNSASVEDRRSSSWAPESFCHV